MKIKNLMTFMPGKQRVSNLNECCPSSSDPENISLPLSLIFTGTNLCWRQPPAHWFQPVAFFIFFSTLWVTLLTTVDSGTSTGFMEQTLSINAVTQLVCVKTWNEVNLHIWACGVLNSRVTFCLSIVNGACIWHIYLFPWQAWYCAWDAQWIRI